MSDRQGNRGVQLPKQIIDQLKLKENAGARRSRTDAKPRKERRKSARVDKKSRAVQSRILRRQQYYPETLGPKNLQALQKHTPAERSLEVDAAEESPSAEEDNFESDSEEVRSTAEERDPTAKKRKVSRKAQERLDEDDLEIRRLEKKLGVKPKSRSSKSDNDDGLDAILDGLGTGISDEVDSPEDIETLEWLQKKRQASKPDDNAYQSDDIANSDFSGFDDTETADEPPTSFGSELMDTNEARSASTSERLSKPAAARENPYRPPVPDSRISHLSNGPQMKRTLESGEISESLRRKVKGLLNRVSEANILSILAEVESLYQDNARQHVSTALMDSLLFHLDIPGQLEDTFVVLHGAFIAGLVKLTGPDFGAEMIKRVTESLERYIGSQNDAESSGKASTNLMALLTELFNFRVVSSDLIYDFIRGFVNEISEHHTELLLKIIKISGLQLRQEDAGALKDIVLTLQATASAAGLSKQTVRTRFMVETIMDLKNNRLKATLQSSGVAMEHRTRLKKSLGSMPQHKVKASEPLRITLSDIHSSESKGRWWVVGAKYTNDQPESMALDDRLDLATDAAGTEDGDVDIAVLAKRLRINTEVRRAIFLSIMSSTDFQDAYLRLTKLRLKKTQESEIPRILVQCVTTEQSYNPYYALIAGKLCGDKRMKMSFQFTLWDTIKSLAQDPDDGDDLKEPDSALETRAVVHLGKMYGYLVGERRLDVKIIKNIDMAYLNEGEVRHVFLEVFLMTLILHCYRGSEESAEDHIIDVFGPANELPDLAQGLRQFLRSTIRHTDTAKKSQRKALRAGCKLVEPLLKRGDERGGLER